MKGKDIQTKEIVEETQEEKAKRVIENIQKIILERKEKVKEAEDKLAEVLEKDIENIKDKDGRDYEWD